MADACAVKLSVSAIINNPMKARTKTVPCRKIPAPSIETELTAADSDLSFLILSI